MRFGSRRGWAVRRTRFLHDRRSAEMLELAIVFPVFLLFLLFLFEVAYDQFQQTELEGALQLTAYQVQVGNYSDTKDAAHYIDKDFCQNALAGALNCANIYVRLQAVDPTQCTTDPHDFYDMTQGSVPVSGGKLKLGDYENDQNNPGSGAAIGPTACSGSNETGFCNAGSNQFIIFTAIYVSPTFLGGLITGAAYTYGGQIVHAAIATEAFYTEAFLPTGVTETSPAC